MDKGRDPTDLRGQEIERADKQRRDDLALKCELDDMKFIMSTSQGRRFMWALLDKCGVYRTSFTGNSTTFFNEGMRNIGIMLTSSIMNACPEAYLVMINEAKEQEQ